MKLSPLALTLALLPAGQLLADTFERDQALKLPDVNKVLTETQGMDVVALGPDATRKWIAENMERWGKVVRDNNIRAE